MSLIPVYPSESRGGDNCDNCLNMDRHQLSKWLKWGPTRVLYQYQANHVKTMLYNCSFKSIQKRHGIVLADEMGLGKTLQSLSVAAGLEQLNSNRPPALLIIPPNVFDQWVAEALLNTRWTDDEIFIYHGPNRVKTLEARKINLKEQNTKTLYLRVGRTLNQIQNLMHQSGIFTFENVKIIIAATTFGDNDKLLLEIQTIFSKFKDAGVIYSKIAESVRNFRSIWNPKKRIRLIFTTQDIVRSEGAGFMKKESFGSLFYDEAHDIRNGVKAGQINRKHKTSKAMFSLSKRIRSYRGKRYPVFALSGTPIFNDHEDLVSILHFIGQEPECDPAYFQSDSTMKKRLDIAKEKYFIRGLAIDYLDLPDKYVCTHFFHFSAHEVKNASHLMQQLSMLNRQKEHAGGKEKLEIQNKMQACVTRMRQQCVSEELIHNPKKIEELYDKAYVIPDGKITNEDQRYIVSAMENSTKLFQYVQDIYKRTNGKLIHPTNEMNSTNSGELVIVTSEWVRALKLIALILLCPTVTKKYLPYGSKAPKLFMYHGGLNKKQKRNVLAASKKSAENETPSVLLLSFHSGNVGLNLFYSRTIMVLEGWWNKALMDQMACRVHRNGQTRKCDIHQYVVEGTIEQHILWLQDNKHFIAMNVYGNEKEKLHAKAQREKRGKKNKGFRLKEAVQNMKRIRAQYAQETENSSLLLAQGFRSKIEVVQPDKDIRKTHTLASLARNKTNNIKKPRKPRSFRSSQTSRTQQQKRKRSKDELYSGPTPELDIRKDTSLGSFGSEYRRQQQRKKKKKRTLSNTDNKKADPFNIKYQTQQQNINLGGAGWWDTLKGLF